MTTTPADPAPPLTPALLLGQLTEHRHAQLRPRLTGLSDEEYAWEPAPGAWSVRPRGTSSAPVQAGSGRFTVDFAFPEPVPAPVTTISWRLAHVVVGVLAVRNAAHAGGPPASYETWDYAGTAADALPSSTPSSPLGRSCRLAQPRGPRRTVRAERGSLGGGAVRSPRPPHHAGGRPPRSRGLPAARPLRCP